jgi:hypothetical protein
LEFTLNNLISSVEKEWLGKLYDHCRSSFKDRFLPSHDHYHHYRVWLFARELFSAFGHAGLSVSAEKICQTIFAVFFHDLGLSVTLAENHGSAGRDLCIEFFRDNDLKPPAGFEEILDAIEKHDDKTVSNTQAGVATGKFTLLDILRTCDDLDAFGYTGVYRYAEIYMLRRIPDELLAERVLENLDNRYLNFTGIFPHPDAFARHQESRYLITRDFYTALNEETGSSNLLDHKRLIIRVFNEYYLSGKNLLEPGCNYQISHNNVHIQNFINLLQQENDSWPYPHI